MMIWRNHPAPPFVILRERSDREDPYCGEAADHPAFSGHLNCLFRSQKRPGGNTRTRGT